MLDFLRDALCVSRLTRLVVDDAITAPIRDAAMAADPDRKHIGYLATCSACASVWTGLISLILPRQLRWALALSEVTILLREKFT